MSAGIRAGSSNDGYVQVNGNDIITALSSGNVGIGNTSPSTKLHVNGTVTASNFIGTFSGNSNISVDDWIVHTGDTDTKLGFPAADQIQFNTAGTNYLKLHRYSSVNFVEAGADAHISLANNGSNIRSILIGDGNASSTGGLRLQAGGGSTTFGGGIVMYSHANSTNAGGVYIGKSLNSSGSIILGNGGTTPTHEYLKINSSGKSSFKSQGTNTVCISLLDNDSSNEIWRVGQAADGDGYVEVLEDGGTVGCKLDASGNSFTMGNFGIGDASPSQLLTISHAANTTNGILIKNTNNSQASAIAQLELSGGDNSHGRVQFECNGKYSTIRHDGNGHLTFWTDGSNERLRITSDGKVKVTSTAKDLLYLNSSHSDGLQVPLQSNGTDFAYIGSGKTLFSGGSVTDLGFRTATNITFGVGSNEKVRITSSRFLVGTTDTSGYNNRSAYFHNGIHGDAWNYVSITGGSSGGAGLVFGDSTGQSTGNYESYMYHDNNNNNFYVRTDQGNKTFTFDNNGDLNISDGNLVVASTHGIDFSANADNTTSGTSTGSELLDYYEEGTWTPSMDTNGSGVLSASYTKQTGTYTRIGRLVYIMFDMVVSNTPSGNAGYPMITGLPFTPTVGQSNQGGYPIPQFRDSSAMPVDARLYNSSYGHNQNNAIWIQYQNSSGAIQQPAGGTWWSSGRCQGEMVYYTS